MRVRELGFDKMARELLGETADVDVVDVRDLGKRSEEGWRVWVAGNDDAVIYRPKSQ